MREHDQRPGTKAPKHVRPDLQHADGPSALQAPLGAAAVTDLQRMAGNAAVVTAVQREDAKDEEVAAGADVGGADEKGGAVEDLKDDGPDAKDGPEAAADEGPDDAKGGAVPVPEADVGTEDEKA